MDEPENTGTSLNKLPAENSESKPVKSEKENPVTRLINKQTDFSKTDEEDTLINVHIGNPLKRITEILEDIKKQKAFSFTLKGSLGIMGVALVLSLLGIFGTSYALCDKGVQTHKGYMKVLKVTDTEPDHLVAKIQRAIKFFSTFFSPADNSSPRYRYILELADNTTIHLSRGRDASFTPFKDKAVYATGNYDSCSRELTIQTPEAIEEFQN